VDRANDWLDKNRDVQVKTCQTMTWMSHDSSRLGSGEFMISSKNFTENAVTYYLRGLRYALRNVAVQKCKTINQTLNVMNQERIKNGLLSIAALMQDYNDIVVMCLQLITLRIVS